MEPVKYSLDIIDIDGLDPAGFSLAIGWWFLIIVSILLIFIICVCVYVCIIYRKNRLYLMYKKLKNVKENISEENANESAIYIAMLLKQAAIETFSRPECAGLYGIEWMRWLNDKVADCFPEDMMQKVQQIIYAPPGAIKMEINEVRDFAINSLQWIRCTWKEKHKYDPFIL